MTTVTDADREAAADYFGMTNDALRADFARSGKYDLSVCVQSFAHHRHQAIAEIKRERDQMMKIVRWVAGKDTVPEALTGRTCANEPVEGRLAFIAARRKEHDEMVALARQTIASIEAGEWK